MKGNLKSSSQANRKQTLPLPQPTATVVAGKGWTEKIQSSDLFRPVFKLAKPRATLAYND